MQEQAAMKSMDYGRLASLLRGQRWACIGTLADNKPYVSWVAVVAEPDFAGVVLHLSRLAKHTRNLEANHSVSLTLSEADDGQSDPQQLARLTLEGEIALVTPEDADYARLRKLYLERLPDAEMLFQFSDFSLFRFTPRSGRYVEGFASSHAIDPESLRVASQV